MGDFLTQHGGALITAGSFVLGGWLTQRVSRGSGRDRLKAEQAAVEQDAYREYLEALGILVDALVRINEEFDELVPMEWGAETDELFVAGRDRHYNTRALMLLISRDAVRSSYDRLEESVTRFWERIQDREVPEADRIQALADLRDRRDEFAIEARDRLVSLRGF